MKPLLLFQRHYLLGIASGIIVAIAVFLQGFKIEKIILVQSLVLFLLLFYICKSYTHKVTLTINWLFAFLTLLWAWQIASLWFGICFEMGIYCVLFMSALPLNFYFYQLVKYKNSFWKAFAIIFIATGVISASFGIGQFYSMKDPNAFFVTYNTHAAFLNLLFLLFCSQLIYFFYKNNKPKRVIIYFYLIVLFILCQGIHVTSSRGGSIGLILGLAVLLFSVRKYMNKIAFAAIMLTLVVSFIDPYIKSDHFLERKMLGQTDHAFSARMEIWKASIKLWEDYPWYGVGAGNFITRYSAYSTPQDISARQYVHNDYLQLLIELGYPGFLLFCGLLLSVAVYYILFLRSQPKPPARFAAAGVFSAMLAVAAHSFVDYNFYILPILLIFGIYLGRFNQIATRHYSKQISFYPDNHLTRPGFYGVLLGITGFIALFAISIFLASFWYKKGWNYFVAHDIVHAEYYFNKVEKLSATSPLETARGMLYLDALEVLPKEKYVERKSLYDAALAAFEQGLTINPYHKELHYFLALLYENFPEFSGKNSNVLAETQFTEAIACDPRYVTARFAYAKLLIKQGKKSQAKSLLETGFTYGVPYDKQSLVYLQLLQQLCKENGDEEGYKKLSKQIFGLQVALDAKRL